MNPEIMQYESDDASHRQYQNNHSKPMTFSKDEIEFLIQSNAIEGEHGSDMLWQSLIAWDYLRNLQELTLQDVLKVHKILMLHARIWPNEKGYLREVPVYIGGHEAMDHKEIKAALKSWLVGMNAEYRGYFKSPKDILSKGMHVEYEKIHPFVDGNGRTGRMFMNWQRLRNGQKLLIIHTGAEQDAYYQWFK